jgi:hypothetical protein
MRFAVAPGEHRVVVRFKETPLRSLADLISLLSLGIIGGLLIKSRKR